MMAGHYGIGFALKRLNTGINLAVLFVAVQLVDIFWTIFVLLGIEQVRIAPGIVASSPLEFVYYPFTHSLLAFILWAILGFLAFLLIPFRYRGRKIVAAAIIALGVFSHFVLDLIVHAPDLPLAGQASPKMGLGLWNNVWLSIIVEFAIFIGGLLLYLSATRGRGFWSRYGVIIFAVLLAVFQLMGSFAPPPTNARQVAIGGLALYLATTLAGYFIDRGRAQRLVGIWGKDNKLPEKSAGQSSN